MIRPKKIALAIAFSPTAPAMLRAARGLAARFGATLLLVHIGERTAEAESRMETLLADGFGSVNPEVVWRPAGGDPASRILDVVQAEGVDLLVAGALKKENLIQYYLGTVARRIMRKADCSVLFLNQPTGEELEFNHIVVNAEDSPYVREAIRLACQIGEFNPQSWVHIVKELKMYGLTMAVSDQCTAEEYEKIRQRLVQEEIHRVEQMLEKVRHPGLRINIKVVTGKSGFELSQFAQRKEADLLVLGAPGRRFRLFDRVFPHDQEYIFADMPCHLLVVHPKVHTKTTTSHG